MVLAGWFTNSAPQGNSPLKRALAAYKRLDLTVVGSPRTPHERSKRAKTLNATELEQVREGYLAGATSRELGVRFQVNEQTIQRKLRKMDLHIRGHSLNPEETEEAARLYIAGMSAKKIGVQLGYSEGGVRNALVRVGVEIRPSLARSRQQLDGQD